MCHPNSKLYIVLPAHFVKFIEAKMMSKIFSSLDEVGRIHDSDHMAFTN